jgi:hypothetical protein
MTTTTAAKPYQAPSTHNIHSTAFPPRSDQGLGGVIGRWAGLRRLVRALVTPTSERYEPRGAENGVLSSRSLGQQPRRTLGHPAAATEVIENGRNG